MKSQDKMQIAPKRARTSNHLVRSQVLYPVELSVQKEKRFYQMMTIEAIILKSVRLQEHGQILTLFSKELGIISLITKTRKIAFSPLLKVEAQLLAQQRELKKCAQIEITGSYQALRLSLQKLSQAVEMIDFVRRELPAEEPVPFLFELLDKSLQAMCESRDVTEIGTLFYNEWKLFHGEIAKEGT
jgi:DNA repair protein RecO